MKRDPFFPSPRYEIDRLFDTMIHTAWGGRAAKGAWFPAADVTEEADRYLLEMDLPGVHIADVSITAENGVLRIEGARERTRGYASGRHCVVERVCGRFARAFRLPEDADVEGIRARLEEGILTVVVPRIAQRRTR